MDKNNGMGRGRGRGRGKRGGANNNGYNERGPRFPTRNNISESNRGLQFQHSFPNEIAPVPSTSYANNNNITNKNTGYANGASINNNKQEDFEKIHENRIKTSSDSSQSKAISNNSHTVPNKLEIVPYETAVNTNKEIRPNFPKRPDYGNLGHQIKVKVNYFPLVIPGGNVYCYDVQILTLNNENKETKRSPSKTISRLIIDKLTNDHKEFKLHIPAYDGKKNLIMRTQLFSDTRSFIVELDENEECAKKAFKVVIKPLKDEHIINLDDIHNFFKGQSMEIPLRAITALDIIMRTGLNLRFTPVGKSLFYKPDPDNLHPLGGGKEVWFGYYQSVRPTQWKLMVNIDKANCAFHEKQTVLQFFERTLKKTDLYSPLTYSELKNINEKIKDLKVKVTHQNYPRKYTVFGVTKQPLSVLTFDFTENNVNRKMKVVDYFMKQYQYRLRYVNLPALNIGSKDKPKYMPVEVCEIFEGQPYKKLLTDEQTKKMISFTCLPPYQRFKEIEESAKNTIETNKSFMKEFELQMNTKCIEIQTRYLDPPQVAYNDDKKITPKSGVWDMKQTKFFKSGTIDNWALLSTVPEYKCKKENLQKFERMLIEVGRKMGITISESRCVKFTNSNNIINVLKELALTYKLDLAVIVLPNNKSSVYSDIKNVAETEIGLKTQCVKEINVVKKCTEALISNICQKINAKMDGINCGLSEEEKPEIFKKPVIFLGADVTHPAPGDKTSYSIAAVVGSLDRHPSRYAATARIQCPRENNKKVEIIVDLKLMVKDILKQFYKKTRLKPEKIIFYRDGVSEGEFLQVQNKEISQIREACTELEKGYEPGITYIVVGKRHHMRMMPVHQKDGVGKAGNVPPGTYIDTTITHPTDFDFFLCSHFGIQGTSRPAHYTVLWDDNDFSSNEIQKLSYYLCHIYARCTRSISIPAPVQYAHLAAARAKQHLISKMTEINTSSSSSSENADISIDLDTVKVVKAFMNSMYFV